MQNQRKNILGISPGTHTMGLALIQGKELVEWRMKVFNECWSQVKLGKMLTAIQDIVVKQCITDIAVKIMHPARCSEGLHGLNTGIMDIANSQNITLHSCTVNDIKAHCSLEKKRNKRVIVEYVLQKHPELYREYQKEQGINNSYYIKIFEAIVIARMFHDNME
ncbi:MAG: hypothetical protein Q8M15_16935 [Bacteroidota bacterium]|nr:hypothetical protein [Bacteroidota bacterium]